MALTVQILGAVDRLTQHLGRGLALALCVASAGVVHVEAADLDHTTLAGAHVD